MPPEGSRAMFRALCAMLDAKDVPIGKIENRNIPGPAGEMSIRIYTPAGAIFPGANFRGADLTGALLSDDEFGAADLSMAGNISAAQLLHVRYLPGRPPRLPAGMALPHQNSAMAV